LQAPSQAELDSLKLTLNQLSSISPLLPQFENAGFFSPITTFQSRGNSTYHGLATEVTRRFSRGLLFKGAYTWSHNIDDSTADLAATVLTPRRAQMRKTSGPETRQFHAGPPPAFYHDRGVDAPWFAHSSNWFERNLIGNVSFAGTYTAESPEYATVQSGTDSNLNSDTAGDRAIINPAGDAHLGSSVTPLLNSAGETVGYLANNPDARYIKAGPGAFPNGGRNTLPLRGINNFDLSAVKAFSITERVKAQYRLEMFNALNHTQLDNPDTQHRAVGRPQRHAQQPDPRQPLFNDPTGVYESNARYVIRAARFTF
jgi:hypothetical protein